MTLTRLEPFSPKVEWLVKCPLPDRASMTDQCAAFVLGFSFIQLALASADPSRVSSAEEQARDLHRIQAGQMLTHLHLLDVNLGQAPVGDLAEMRRQAETIFLLLRPRSSTAAWSFRLGCDLAAVGTAQYQGVRSVQIDAFTARFDEECRESGVPFEFMREVLWAAADTTLKRSAFVGCVSEAMNKIAEHLDAPEYRKQIAIQ